MGSLLDRCVKQGKACSFYFPYLPRSVHMSREINDAELPGYYRRENTTGQG